MKILLAAILGTIIIWAVTVRIAGAQNVQANQHTVAGTLEGSHQFTGNKCTAVAVTWHSMTPRWLMIFDTLTMPPQGALSPNVPLIVCQYINAAGSQADGTQNFDWSSHPVIVQNGLLVVVSTNSGACTALTTDGPNNWFAGQMQ